MGCRKLLLSSLVSFPFSSCRYWVPWLNIQLLPVPKLLQLEIIILSEVSQRKTNTLWYHLRVESKIWHKWTYLWNRNRIRDIENRLVVAKGEGAGGRMEWEVRVSKCTFLYRAWINNKVLLHSTENYIQYPMINLNGKEYFKKCTYV